MIVVLRLAKQVEVLSRQISKRLRELRLEPRAASAKVTLFGEQPLPVLAKQRPASAARCVQLLRDQSDIRRRLGRRLSAARRTAVLVADAAHRDTRAIVSTASPRPIASR